MKDPMTILTHVGAMFWGFAMGLIYACWLLEGK